MKKVLIVGIDTATFDIIRPLVEKGEMPNFAKVIKEVFPVNISAAFNSASMISFCIS